MDNKNCRWYQKNISTDNCVFAYNCKDECYFRYKYLANNPSEELLSEVEEKVRNSISSDNDCLCEENRHLLTTIKIIEDELFSLKQKCETQKRSKTWENIRDILSIIYDLLH